MSLFHQAAVGVPPWLVALCGRLVGAPGKWPRCWTSAFARWGLSVSTCRGSPPGWQRRRVLKIPTWWLIPLSKWVITPGINGISRVNPLITGVITHLLTGMSHQEGSSWTYHYDILWLEIHNCKYPALGGNKMLYTCCLFMLCSICWTQKKKTKNSRKWHVFCTCSLGAMMKPLMKWMNPGLSMGNRPENDDEPVDLAAPHVQMNPNFDVYIDGWIWVVIPTSTNNQLNLDYKSIQKCFFFVSCILPHMVFANCGRGMIIPIYPDEQIYVMTLVSHNKCQLTICRYDLEIGEILVKFDILMTYILHINIHLCR